MQWEYPADGLPPKRSLAWVPLRSRRSRCSWMRSRTLRASRGNGLRSLGNLGPDARDVLPALEQATQDTNALVRARAQEAIRRIRAAGEAEGDAPRSEVAALVALRERPTASARRASAAVVAEAGAVSRRL